VRLTEAAEYYLPDVCAALRHLDQAAIAAQAVVSG
jgi:DNA-binding transcriptional LysR family regulator